MAPKVITLTGFPVCFAITSQDDYIICKKTRKICDQSIVSLAFVTVMTLKKSLQSFLQYIRVLYLKDEILRSLQICDKCKIVSGFFFYLIRKYHNFCLK
jgi:hypothetical protein